MELIALGAARELILKY